MNKALIISASAKNLSSVELLLKSEGFNKIVSISSGNEVRRMVSTAEFELIVIDAPLPDEFGHELSIMLTENSAAGIILLCSNDIADSISDKVAEHGVCVVPKPLNRQLFQRSVKLVMATRSRMLGQKKENVKLLTKIDEMRLINRAKCTLMEYLKFTEPQAHRYIEKQAMNTRQTRREVAMRILATYER